MDSGARAERHDSPRGMALAVGRVRAAHGIRGEVVVDVHTDDPEARFVPGAVLPTEPPVSGPLTVRGSRWYRGRLLVSFEESADRSTAESLCGTTLVVYSTDVAASEDENEFHDHELIDLAVVTVAGQRVGTVTDVLHPPGQDLLAVHLCSGGDALVPFVAAIVQEVDRTAGLAVIDPPPGLLDQDTSE